FYDTEIAESLRPHPMGRLPGIAVARVPVHVVTAVPADIEDVREGQSEESLLAGVFGVSDEVNAPLPSLVSSDAAMRKMFVESDDVSRFGLDREGCMLLSDVSSMAAGSDFERTASAAQRFEVRDESDARNVEVTVGMPVAFTEVPRALRSSR